MMGRRSQNPDPPESTAATKESAQKESLIAEGLAFGGDILQRYSGQSASAKRKLADATSDTKSKKRCGSSPSSAMHSPKDDGSKARRRRKLTTTRTSSNSSADVEELGPREVYVMPPPLKTKNKDLVVGTKDKVANLF